MGSLQQGLGNKPIDGQGPDIVGCALGDILAQFFLSGGPFDIERFLTLSMFGLIYHGHVSRVHPAREFGSLLTHAHLKAIRTRHITFTIGWITRSKELGLKMLP
jgi:hypothetical protein